MRNPDERVRALERRVAEGDFDAAHELGRWAVRLADEELVGPALDLAVREKTQAARLVHDLFMAQAPDHEILAARERENAARLVASELASYYWKARWRRLPPEEQPGYEGRPERLLNPEQIQLPFEEKCVFCGQEPFVDVLEYWPTDRSFMLDTCCEGQHAWWLEEMKGWTPEEWQRFFAMKTGAKIRSVGGDPTKPAVAAHRAVAPEDTWTVDQGITVVPSTNYETRNAGGAPPGALTRAEAKEFVKRFHSHAGERPPAGWIFGFGIFNGPPSDPIYEGLPRARGKGLAEHTVGLVRWPPMLIGVAMVGRPEARMTEKAAKARGEKVAQVTRVALNHGLPPFVTYRASSMVYEAAAETARALDFDRIITFTLGEESGMSLRYARWKRVGVSKPKAKGWGRKGRPRAARAGALAQDKVKWELYLRPRR